MSVISSVSGTTTPPVHPSTWDVLNSPFVDTILFAGIVSALCGRFLLDPYIAFRKTIRDIDASLILYANSFARSVQMSDTTSRPITGHFRGLASDFASNYRAIPLRGLFAKCKLIPTKQQMKDVQEGLIYLANTVGETQSDIDNPHDVMLGLRIVLKIEV